MTQAEQFIENEMDLRTKLVNNPKFIKQSVEVAKKIGITASEWNKNKIAILMYFANQALIIDRENGDILRNKLIA
jgi:hypothetical protein